MTETGTNLTGNKDTDMKWITSLALLLIASVGMAQQVPNTFSAGSPAVADEVNANFADVDGRINTNASAIDANTTGIDANTTGIDDTVAVVDQLFTAVTVTQPAISRGEITAQMTCPVDTIPMSASCGCDTVDASGNETNFGTISR